MNPIPCVHRAAALFWPALVLLLAPSQSGSRPQSAPHPVARILGQVLGADGKPAAGAVVHAIQAKRAARAIPIAVGHALPEAEDVEETSVVADGSGRFKLDVGEFECFGVWGEGGDDASSLAFPVAAGDTVVVRLAATRTVEGKVVADGAGGAMVPAAGARVLVDLKPAQIFGYNWSGLRWPTWSRTVVSGADGAFSLRVPASANVSAIASLGGKTSALVWQDPDKNEPLRLVLAAPGTLRGTVLDERTRAPVAGAQVRWRYGEHATCVTDAEGRFALSPLRNDVEVLVIAPEHALTAARPTPEQLGGAPIEIALAPGLRLHARLLREDGRPLTGSRLAFATEYRVQPKDPKHGGSGGSVSFPGTVGDDGTVRLGWLQRGVPLNAYVEVDGSWASFHWSRPAADVTLGDVRVCATAALEGTVLGHDGTPVGAAAVRVLPQVDGVADLADGIGTQWIGVITNRAGRFRIGGLKPGRYRIGALAPGQGLVVADVEATAAPKPLALRAPRGESVDGKVLDAADRPIADAWVMLQSAAPNRDAEALWFDRFWCRSDGDGKFAFRGLPDGPFALDASATVESKSLIGRIQSVAAGEKDVTVVLEEQRR